MNDKITKAERTKIALALLDAVMNAPIMINSTRVSATSGSARGRTVELDPAGKGRLLVWAAEADEDALLRELRDTLPKARASAVAHDEEMQSFCLNWITETLRAEWRAKAYPWLVGGWERGKECRDYKQHQRNRAELTKRIAAAGWKNPGTVAELVYRMHGPAPGNEGSAHREVTMSGRILGGSRPWDTLEMMIESGVVMETRRTYREKVSRISQMLCARPTGPCIVAAVLGEPDPAESPEALTDIEARVERVKEHQRRTAAVAAA